VRYALVVNEHYLCKVAKVPLGRTADAQMHQMVTTTCSIKIANRNDLPITGQAGKVRISPVSFLMIDGRVHQINVRLVFALQRHLFTAILLECTLLLAFGCSPR